MAGPADNELKYSEKDLHHWNKLKVFQEVLEKVCKQRAPLHPTFTDPRRTLGYAPYLSLFLFGLFNPVVESMRGLCAASTLRRVQEEIGCKKVSLGSFSELQSVVDPQLLAQVFDELFDRTQSRPREDSRLAKLKPILQDGSLWRALPRMKWAQYGVGSKGEAKGVRLHLRFNLVEDKPARAQVTPGAGCERQALRRMLEPGQTNVGDRLYGADYRLFAQIDQAGAFFVFRIKEGATIEWEQELPLSAADREAGVVRQGWARLGATPALLSMRLRVIEIRTSTHHLLLVTNLPVDQAPAELVGLVYRRRWAIELFFRWIKCILGCRHFFAESPAGVAIQLYLALIASLLFQMYTGRRPNKRMMELIQFYLMGWASAEDLFARFQAEIARQNADKKA